MVSVDIGQSADAQTRSKDAWLKREIHCFDLPVAFCTPSSRYLESSVSNDCAVSVDRRFLYGQAF